MKKLILPLVLFFAGLRSADAQIWIQTDSAYKKKSATSIEMYFSIHLSNPYDSTTNVGAIAATRDHSYIHEVKSLYTAYAPATSYALQWNGLYGQCSITIFASSMYSMIDVAPWEFVLDVDMAPSGTGEAIVTRNDLFVSSDAAGTKTIHCPKWYGCTYSVRDCSGRLLKTVAAAGERTDLDASDLASGTYILSAVRADWKTSVQFVK